MVNSMIPFITQTSTNQVSYTSRFPCCLWLIWSNAPQKKNMSSCLSRKMEICISWYLSWRVASSYIINDQIVENLFFPLTISIQILICCSYLKQKVTWSIPKKKHVMDEKVANIPCQQSQRNIHNLGVRAKLWLTKNRGSLASTDFPLKSSPKIFWCNLCFRQIFFIIFILRKSFGSIAVKSCIAT